jgi:hypothetical protein
MMQVNESAVYGLEKLSCLCTKAIGWRKGRIVSYD